MAHLANIPLTRGARDFLYAQFLSQELSDIGRSEAGCNFVNCFLDGVDTFLE
jgi:hypothetical protein